MKTKLFSRSIAMLLCLSLLFTGFAIPASTTTISNSVASSDEFKIDENITKDDDQVVFEKKPISSDDIAISNESMILKYVDSSQFNEAKHTQRLTELEELNTYVFDNVDGTRSVYVMHENVKYIDENGSIKEKDISLISKKGGFGTVQNDIELLIPNNPTQGIDIEYSEFAVKLIPQDLTDKISAKQTDNSIVYEKAYGEKTKLIYTPLLSGVKEDIILTEYTSDASYTFVLKTDGLNLYKNDSGYYLSKNSKDDPVFYLGEIIVYDAIGKPDVGTMAVETVSAGEEYLLTVTANDDFLSDPTTVYPVTIDPSITVSENNADNSIIDAPIYQGYPDRNFATYTYNRVGTPTGNNGIGRTAVKLSGLTSQSAYQTITASQITDVTFHVREASGGSAQYINIYPLTSNTTWTETSMTWNSVGNWSTTLNCGNTMNGAQWTAFNITNLVKAWKNNTYSANAGFIMISNNESVDKSFCSSEYSSNTSYRPYVVMTYNPVISLNYSSTSIVEGRTKTLIASTKPSGQNVTWSTSNSAIATVSSTGVVTAIKAGEVTITAKFVDADGITRSAFCSVYVYIANGVYCFNNVYNNYRIEFIDMSSYGENEPLTAWYSETDKPTERFRLFKICYLGDGLYSIRSMLDSSMGWTRSGTSLISTTVGTSDDTVPPTAKWRIKSNTNGYYIHSYYGTSRTVTCPSNIDADWDIILTSYSSSNTLQNWNIQRIVAPYHGVDIRNDTSHVLVGSSFTFTASIYTSYAGEYGQDGIEWSVSELSGSATVNSSGTLTGISSGTVIVTATYSPVWYEEWSDSRVVTIYSLEDIQSMRMTRDASDEYTLCVATRYNGEKYWYQIDDNGNCSDVLLLSDHIKNWLNDCYNACVNNIITSPFSMEYCVYQAKNKLDDAINNNQLYNVGQSSDEYYGLWLYFSLLEENYRQAILLALDIENLVMTFVDVAEQAYVLAHNISMLVDAVQIHNSVQLMSGLSAARSFGLLTDAQAFNEGITDVVTYTGPRPTWRQSEIYASTTLYTSDCGYLYNQSYKLDANGKFVRAQYGELGSIRPDFYNELTEHCVDIKNYTVTTTSGRNNLVNNVVNQYDNRINILPASTKYEVVVDVRGQSWSQDMLDDILSRITQRTNGKVAVSFVK